MVVQNILNYILPILWNAITSNSLFLKMQNLLHNGTVVGSISQESRSVPPAIPSTPVMGIASKEE